MSMVPTQNMRVPSQVPVTLIIVCNRQALSFIVSCYNAGGKLLLCVNHGITRVDNSTVMAISDVESSQMNVKWTFTFQEISELLQPFLSKPRPCSSIECLSGSSMEKSSGNVIVQLKFPGLRICIPALLFASLAHRNNNAALVGKINRKTKAFGGIKLMCIIDYKQLKPVHGSTVVFPSFITTPLHFWNLHTVKRAYDDQYVQQTLDMVPPDTSEIICDMTNEFFSGVGVTTIAQYVHYEWHEVWSSEQSYWNVILMWHRNEFHAERGTVSHILTACWTDKSLIRQ